MSNGTLTVGLAQIAPVWLDRDSTIAKIVDWIGKAGDQGCKLVVFGEALLPGYPFWVEGQIQDLTWEASAAYIENAIEIGGPETEALCASAKKAGMSNQCSAWPTVTRSTLALFNPDASACATR